MKSPEFAEKCTKGPVAYMTVLPNGLPQMGASLGQWFGYSLLVGLFAGYVASRALGPGAHYLEVFRFVGTVAFLGYGLALMQNSIWYKRNSGRSAGCGHPSRPWRFYSSATEGPAMLTGPSGFAAQAGNPIHYLGTTLTQ
jgi:hypothetical protein